MFTHRYRLVAALFAVCAVCMASPAVETSAPHSAESKAVPYRVGIGKADITPPPGLSTGGHGLASSIARGTLTRLYIRTVLLQSPGSGSSSLVMVSVDAFAVPSALPAAAQKALQKRGIEVDLSSIVVAATHTHHGPANYLGARMYNRFGSRVEGYDPDMRALLIGRLEESINQAADDARDSAPASLRLRSRTISPEAWRNRSPQTFMLNRDAAAILQEYGRGIPPDGAACKAAMLDGEQDGAWDIYGCPRLAAVDRRVSVLDVLEVGHARASLIFAAVHPTVLAPDTPLYGGDMVGIAMAELEAEHEKNDSAPVRSAGPPHFVAAFFNGAEGDITTRRVRRDLRDVWRHARFLVDAVRPSAGAPGVDVALEITTALHVAAAGDAREAVRLAEKPNGGVAALGGAEGDRTPFYDLGWRERVRRPVAQDDQGTKLPALKSPFLPLPDLTFLLASSGDFVKRLPITYVRIGTLEIAVVPSEISTSAGFAVRKALANPNALIVGLANEYASYTATAEEYARQDYMGASTLWGPGQAQFFAQTLAKLKAGPFEPHRTLSDAPGRNGRFKPLDVGDLRPFADEDLDLLLKNKEGNPVRDLPCFIWSATAATGDYGDLAPPRVVVESADASVHDDETRGRIIVLLLASPKHGSATWGAIWTARLADAFHASSPVRFVVTYQEGKKEKKKDVTIMSEWRDPATRGCIQAPSSSQSRN